MTRYLLSIPMLCSFSFVIFDFLSVLLLQPSAGTAIPGKGVVICKYQSDPTVALGLLSVIFLAASAVAGFSSLFYPYKGKSIPQSVLLSSTSFLIFLNVAL